MSRSRPLARRTLQVGGNGVSLFPFLAVLICTMGALILLLVVIARQARVQAAQAAAEKAEQNQRDVAAELEMVRWRIEQLQQSRATTESQLAEARLQLGQIEDHARRLAKQLADLETEARRLGQAGSANRHDKQQLVNRLTELRQQIADADRALEAANRQAARQQKSYAIIPYKGPHQTHRRPIYIECREDAIVVQPEGIELRPNDFQGPGGPGNPLASAMRAIREYLVNQPGYDLQADGEPYPLLLVRPDGVVAYAQARTALESWGADFGYELIDGDWELEYQPRDPTLAQVAQHAIDVARVRQQRLVAAAPRSYGRGSGPGGGDQRPVYRVAPHGGIMLDSGSPGAEAPPLSRRPGVGFGTSDRRGRGSNGDRADHQQASSRTTSATTTPAPSGSSLRSSEPSARYANPYRETPDEVAPDGSGQRRSDGYQPSGERGSAGAPPNLAAGAPRENSQSGGQPSSAARPGMWVPGMGKATAADGASPPASQACPLSEQRGRDWGLPGVADGSVPITRPIRVDCFKDRLVLVPERGDRGRREIALESSTRTAIDELVSAVWDYMDTWGIAGRGMYWKPILSVRVAPDARARFEDLQTLLEGSGLAVREAE